MDELQGGARRMIKKQVYLVRHGESVTNATKIHFGPSVELTELGKEQAKVVAGRLKKIGATRIIASPYKRTRATGEEIAGALGLPLEYSELFVERRGPSVVHNRHGDEPEVRRVWHEISTNAHVPGWRHSDEENFTDLLLRAKQALAFLEALPEECVIVVSHGMTLKMLLAHILLGDRLDGRIFWDCFVPAKNIANTGIMHVEFTDRFDGKGLYWKLVSWNDHAHLDRDELT